MHGKEKRQSNDVLVLLSNFAKVFFDVIMCLISTITIRIIIMITIIDYTIQHMC